MKLAPLKILPLFLLLITSPLFANDGTRYGGSLILSTTTDPKTFNPITAQETSSTSILSSVFEGLTDLDPETGEVIPNLAREWKWDSSGQVCTITLREDVYWADGVGFTAHDVKFTFDNLIYNPEVLTSSKSIFLIQGKPIEIEVEGEYKIKFKLPSPFAPFLRALSQPILPRHLLEEIVNNGKFNEAWGIGESLSSIVGTGPFQLSRYVSGEKIILKRNPHYWKKLGNRELPFLDQIIFQVIPSPELSLLKFKNRELDIYGLRGIDYPWLKPLEVEKGFTIHELGPGMGTYFFTFNQNLRRNVLTGQALVDPVKLRWFTNQKFREAIAHCIDREKIIKLVFQGQGIAQHGALSPANGFFYNPDVPQYEYDLEKARALLKEIEYQDVDQDGVIEDDIGKEIQFTLLTNAENEEQNKIANLIRKDLSELGFKITIQQIEFNTLVSKLTSTFDWEAVLIGLTGSLDPHFGSNVWRSQGPLHLWNPAQPKPETEWEAELNSIFDAGVAELDPNKRKQLYDRFQEIIATEIPLIYTAIPNRLSAVRNALGNIKPTLFGGVLHNIEEIYLKDK